MLGPSRPCSLLLSALVAGLLTASPAAAAEPPVNDDRAGAVPVALVDGYAEDVRDVSGATRGAEDPDCLGMGSTVWYVLEGTGNPIVIDTAASSFDTGVAVLDADGQALACADTGIDGGAQAFAEVQPAAGETVLVVIGSPYGDYGTDLGVRFQDYPPPPPSDEEPPPPPAEEEPLPPAPVNDTREGSTALGALPVTHEVETAGATSDGTELQGTCGSAHSVWFSYVPAADQHVAIDTFGSAYDTQLSVLRVDAEDDRYLHELACSRDSLGTDQSRVELDLRAGTTYLVLVTSQFRFGGYEAGRLVLNAAEVTPLAVTVATSSDGLVRKDGLAFVDVSLTCSRPADGAVRVLLRQGSAHHVVTGHGDAYVGPCGPAATTRRVLVFPDTAGGFRAGPVTAVATGSATSLEVRAEDVRTAAVRLRSV